MEPKRKKGQYEYSTLSVIYIRSEELGQGGEGGEYDNLPVLL